MFKINKKIKKMSHSVAESFDGLDIPIDDNLQDFNQRDQRLLQRGD